MGAGGCRGMRIEIWSDVVCPWCYIGKRRLERALADLEHADEVELVWRSYQLDPGAPKVPTESTVESLARKYGRSLEGARQMMDQVEAVAAEEGLLYRLAETRRVSTVDAHRLLHLARHDGGPEQQGRVKEGLLDAYFVQVLDVGDHATLRKIGVEAGLDESRVEEVLASDEYAADVWADIEQAQQHGATGVPFFVVDQRYGVAGAQPVEVFAELLERAWSDAHPALTVLDGTAGEAADVCGPEGCA